MSRKKCIAIDARVVVANHGHGIARYTEEYLRHLARMPSEFDYILFLNVLSPLAKLEWPVHFKLVYLKSGWINFIWGQIELAFALRKYKPDLFHSPSFIVPFFSSVPLVTTIHDLNHVVLSENYSKFHRFYYSFLLARKIRSAAKVITVSSFSKNEIIRFFKIPESLVKVIYNGINERFSPQRRMELAEIEHVRDRYELPEKFVLSIGNRKPHKNIKRLVEAYCAGDFNLPLVLLTDFDSKLLDIANNYSKKHLIHFLRFVSNDDFPYVYAASEVFAYTSLYEGFGLPPLEASACNTPVVVSDRTSLPEVMAGFGLFVNPENIESIQLGLAAALKNAESGATQGGEIVAQKFNWIRMAQETQDVYCSILGQKKESTVYDSNLNKKISELGA